MLYTEAKPDLIEKYPFIYRTGCTFNRNVFFDLDQSIHEIAHSIEIWLTGKDRKRLLASEFGNGESAWRACGVVAAINECRVFAISKCFCLQNQDRLPLDILDISCNYTPTLRSSVFAGIERGHTAADNASKRFYDHCMSTFVEQYSLINLNNVWNEICEFFIDDIDSYTELDLNLMINLADDVRLPRFESRIFANPELTIRYVKQLTQRYWWSDEDDHICVSLFYYARHVMRTRWHAAEHIIKQKDTCYEHYIKWFKGRN